MAQQGTDWDRYGPPLDVRPLFPVERGAMLDLLRSLDAEQWRLPTACPGWSVHDVVAHVVHDLLRRLSGTRDGSSSPLVVPRGGSFPEALDAANEAFVEAVRGVSPRVLVDLVAVLGAQLDDVWAALDLAAIGGVDVWWAVPDEPAPVWLDVARELSELWVHQQQVRDAVGLPGADGIGVVGAVVDTLVRGLPRALGAVGSARSGAVVVLDVVGGCRCTWHATLQPGGWALARGGAQDPDTLVRVSAGTLWRLASRGLSPAEARRGAEVVGDEELATAALTLLGVVR